MPTAECAICGAACALPEMPDVEPLEAPALDTRPGEPLRSTIASWMAECPGCGYAAPDVSSAPPPAAEIVASPAYKALQGPFLRHSLLLEKLGFLAEAGWCALHAAWRFDDLDQPDDARAARLHALALWQQGKAAGQAFLDDTAQEFALATDLLRRAALWEEARQTCLSGLEEPGLPPVGEDLLRFQLALIQKQDAAAHSMAELPDRPAGAGKFRIDF